jgi:DNA-binding Lrp family transcriptional regulator
MSPIDERIVRATQAGLPLVEAPYAEIARQVGVGEQEVLSLLKAMLADGRIRRIGAVPNLGALEFVSHCYRRPRRLPDWPYNLFAMVHGRSRDETAQKVEAIRRLLGSALRAHDVLYSVRILKKTGLRL